MALLQEELTLVRKQLITLWDNSAVLSAAVQEQMKVQVRAKVEKIGARETWGSLSHEPAHLELDPRPLVPPKSGSRSALESRRSRLNLVEIFDLDPPPKSRPDLRDFLGSLKR